MLLDVLEFRRAFESLVVPVQPAQPGVQVRIAATDIADVAFEVLHVHGVEAHDGRIQSDVRLGQLRAKVVRASALGQVRLGAVERGEELPDGRLVGLGLGAEAGAVHAVVDVAVRPLVGRIDLLAQPRGQEVDLGIWIGQQRVELTVEHANDLARLVADDGLGLGVVEGRHREAPGVVGVDGEVDVAQVREVGVDGVRPHVFAGEVLVRCHEAPALIEMLICHAAGRGCGHTLVTHMPVHHGVVDDILQTLQLASNECSVR